MNASLHYHVFNGPRSHLPSDEYLWLFSWGGKNEQKVKNDPFIDPITFVTSIKFSGS
jgi:hypothetical protein